MPGLVIGIEIDGEKRLRIALEASVAAIDEIALACSRQWLQIEAAGEDRLDGAVRWRGMSESAHAGGFESLRP